MFIIMMRDAIVLSEVLTCSVKWAIIYKIIDVQVVPLGLFVRSFVQVGPVSAFKRILHNKLVTGISDHLSNYLKCKEKEDDGIANWCSCIFGQFSVSGKL